MDDGRQTAEGDEFGLAFGGNWGIMRRKASAHDATHLKVRSKGTSKD